MGKHRVAARTSKAFAHVLSPLCVAIYYACVLPGAAAVRNPDTVARTPNTAAYFPFILFYKQLLLHSVLTPSTPSLVRPSLLFVFFVSFTA
ncbi:hypothetical protein E2542_SST05484 [Spatholobus suberectus]|nr:hypothetical protein E2542_SST05484 [Spatholobus suberectus]